MNSNNNNLINNNPPMECKVVTVCHHRDMDRDRPQALHHPMGILHRGLWEARVAHPKAFRHQDLGECLLVKGVLARVWKYVNGLSILLQMVSFKQFF